MTTTTYRIIDTRTEPETDAGEYEATSPEAAIEAAVAEFAGEELAPDAGDLRAEMVVADDTSAARLMSYDTAEDLREATAEERDASREASKRDGGAGVITVDGQRCYVQE